MPEELIEVRGQLFQLTILADIVKCVTMQGLDFEVGDFEIAKSTDLPSWVQLRLRAKSEQALKDCLASITQLGAHVVGARDAETERVEQDGILPNDAYALTGLPTEVRANGRWLPVPDPPPLAAIRVDRNERAVAVPMECAKKGDRIVVHSEGVRVSPEPPERESELLGLLGTTVSVARPRGPAVAKIAREIPRVRAAGRKVVLAAGPAVIHSGAGPHLVQLLRGKSIDVLIATNSTAVYDAEAALYGTARGMYLTENVPAPQSAENMIHALNAVRAAGGLRPAVAGAVLTSGVLHACITSEVPFVLIGSAHDEAALPDTLTDTTTAREKLRDTLPGTGLAVMVAEAGLAKAVIQALPGSVPKVYVDTSDYDVAKLVSRGEPSVLGLVESAESFLRELARNLGAW
jgi:lysine-ketoglutarate reductase/saccharopine dehydrogenase-like protein (TIGR00300 family)